MTVGLALTIIVGVAATAWLVHKRNQVRSYQALWSGQVPMGLEPELRALVRELSEASTEVDASLVAEEFGSLVRARVRALAAAPGQLGRIVLFVGAATGLASLAAGLPKAMTDWAGVACLALGFLGRLVVGGVGRHLAHEVDRLRAQMRRPLDVAKLASPPKH